MRRGTDWSTVPSPLASAGPANVSATSISARSQGGTRPPLVGHEARLRRCSLTVLRSTSAVTAAHSTLREWWSALESRSPHRSRRRSRRNLRSPSPAGCRCVGDPTSVTGLVVGPLIRIVQLDRIVIKAGADCGAGRGVHSRDRHDRKRDEAHAVAGVPDRSIASKQAAGSRRNTHSLVTEHLCCSQIRLTR